MPKPSTLNVELYGIQLTMLRDLDKQQLQYEDRIVLFQAQMAALGRSWADETAARLWRTSTIQLFQLAQGT